MESIEKYLVSKSFTIKKALKRMDLLLANTVFVEDNGQLIGSVSSGDIRRALLQEVGLESSISKIMHMDPISVMNDYELAFVKDIFMDKKISAIPIVDSNQKVINIIFRSDIFEGFHGVYGKVDLPVVIMAGGKGCRMDPFTRILPKALIPIDENPIITVIMGEYSKYGMNNFYVSLNHKSKMIKAYFQEYKSSYNVEFLQESTPLGTAGALRFLRHKIESPFFVSNCDIIIKADYAEIYNFHKERDFVLTLVASMQHHIIPYGVCELDEQGVLKAIKERPEYDLLMNTGMYILNPETLNYIPENTIFDMTDLINELKNNNYEIGVYPVSEKSWVDIGQWDKYRESANKLNDLLREPD